MALRCKWYHVWFHISCLVHGLHGVWDVGTLGITLSGCVTQDHRVNLIYTRVSLHTSPVFFFCYKIMLRNLFGHNADYLMF